MTNFVEGMLERWLFNMYRVCGLAPVRHVGPGQYQVLKLFHLVYASLITCSVLEFNYKLIEVLYSSHMSTRNLVNQIEVIATSCCAGFCIAVGNRLWLSVANCPPECQLGEPTKERSRMSLLTVCQVAASFEFFVVVYCFFYWANQDHSPPKIRLLQFYTYHYVLMMQSLLTVSILDRARTDLERINRLILDSVITHPHSTLRHPIWSKVNAEKEKVREWIDEVVPTQGASVAANLLFLCFLLITSPYRTLKMIKSANSGADLELQYILINSLWSLAYASRIAALLTSYHITKQQDVRCSDMLLDLLNEDIPEHTRQELAKLLREVSSRRIDLSAHRLYEIDFSCIKPIINFITTYLAILLTYKNTD